MKAELSAHLELMDHEISGLDFQIEHQAYRVDGDAGIKTVVKLNNRKSIDYFYIKNDKCLFIEFTDLARNKEDLLGVEDSISDIGNKFHQNKLSKLIKNDHRDEMVAKFISSKDIVLKIPDYYKNIPHPFLKKDAKTFYIIHVPVNENLPEVDKVEIIRYLSGLRARISACLEDEICDRVKLIFLEKFIRELE